LILREKGVRRVVVPFNFPLGLANELRRLRIAVKARPGSFFPQREQKTPAEVRKISAALVMAEVGMSEAMQVLRASKIGRDRRLIYHNVPLTSEKLRSVIDIAILQACGLAANTIVAGGKQGCDPHERGFGPLRANEPVILDIFPRSQKTGYYGDHHAHRCARARQRGSAPALRHGPARAANWLPKRPRRRFDPQNPFRSAGIFPAARL
jgi:Xaa-Pro aminopeptidase